MLLRQKSRCPVPAVRILNSHAASAVVQRCARIDASGQCTPRDDASRSCCPTGHILLNSGRERIVDCYSRVCGGGETFTNVKHILANHSLVRTFKRHAPQKTVMSGVFGLAVARSLCTRRIRVYGFTSHQASTSAAYHYYDGCDAFTADVLNTTSLVASWLDTATNPVAGTAPIEIRPASGGWPTYESSNAAARLGPCAARSGIGVRSTHVQPSHSNRPSTNHAAFIPLPQHPERCVHSSAERRAPQPTCACIRRAIPSDTSTLPFAPQVLSSILSRAAWAATTAPGGNVPCCNESHPEPKRVGRCAWYADRGECDKWRTWCQVACDYCQPCAGHPMRDAYLRVWMKMRHPPLAATLSANAKRRSDGSSRAAVLTRAMRRVPIYQSNTSRMWADDQWAVGVHDVSERAQLVDWAQLGIGERGWCPGSRQRCKADGLQYCCADPRCDRQRSCASNVGLLHCAC